MDLDLGSFLVVRTLIWMACRGLTLIWGAHWSSGPSGSQEPDQGGLLWVFIVPMRYAHEDVGATRARARVDDLDRVT